MWFYHSFSESSSDCYLNGAFYNSGLDEIRRGERRWKDLRETKLNASSPGAVHDAVQTVGDGEDRAVGKLFTDGVLDQVVCLQVDSCRGLIQD